jgi:predicted RNase H-like nuclease (RuvC/YqgF family)
MNKLTPLMGSAQFEIQKLRKENQRLYGRIAELDLENYVMELELETVKNDLRDVVIELGNVLASREIEKLNKKPRGRYTRVDR